MSRFNCYRDGQMHVVEHMCSTCIFRTGNLMHLKEGRRDQLVADSIKRGTAIICHSTMDTAGNAICRGFFDNHAGDVFALRLASAMGIVEFDAPKSFK